MAERGVGPNAYGIQEEHRGAGGLGRMPVCLPVRLRVQYELLWSWVIEENGGLDVGHRKGQSSV